MEKGLREDLKRSYEYYDQSAAFGYMLALVFKAYILFNGNEVTARNRTKSLELMEMAAQIGDKYAKDFLKRNWP